MKKLMLLPLAALLMLASCTEKETLEPVESTLEEQVLQQEISQEVVNEINRQADAAARSEISGTPFQGELRADCTQLFNWLDDGDLGCTDGAGSLVTQFTQQGCLRLFFNEASFPGVFRSTSFAPFTLSYYVDGDGDINSDTNILPDLEDHADAIVDYCENVLGFTPWGIYGGPATSFTCNERANNTVLMIYRAYY